MHNPAIPLNLLPSKEMNKMSQQRLIHARKTQKRPIWLTTPCGVNAYPLRRTLNYNIDNGANGQHEVAVHLSGLKALKSKRKNQNQRRMCCPQAVQCHQRQWWLLFLVSIFFGLQFVEQAVPLVNADESLNVVNIDATSDTSATNDSLELNATIFQHNVINTTFSPLPSLITNTTDAEGQSTNTTQPQRRHTSKFNAEDSIFLRFVKRFTDDNNLVSGIVQDCYHKPTFSCFQKNVYMYLNDVLDSQDLNATQRVKFFKNQNAFQYDAKQAELNELPDEQFKPTQASAAKDWTEQENEIPRDGRSFAAPAATPIEEVTNALYGKSIKFAMTHDIEMKLPEMMFDGATFRISPKSIEGNGVIAKLELIPKQSNEGRLAGKLLMKKLQKILKSKLLLSFLALVLIIKIIKIKLFWLLPLVVGVGAAKKLLLKFLLFLFPALSHLFKLCSYYQQTYHSTKYHHHHHHINHHHTIIPPWQSGESHHIPEHIISHPPKGHPSTYLHGAPIHEQYTSVIHEPYGAHAHSHEHFENAWESSGPGLGSEYISDINRSTQIEEKDNYFQPHENDVNELHNWGLGTTPLPKYGTQKKRQPPPPQPLHPQHQRLSSSIQKPPIQPQNYQKPQATSQTFNPFLKQSDKQSFYNNKFKNNLPLQSAPSPVYTPVRQVSLPPLQQSQLAPQINGAISAAAQIAAQYDPTRNQPQQQQQLKLLAPRVQQELTPELKEALRIQAEQRLVQQQQQILDKQPFVQDGQPLMPLNYDPFYSPILLKIDKIIEQLGINDATCKERVVCSMYKDPERYSPHSNFVSAELSRDTNELQPITNTNGAVVRFFRLIQAARDGQDQKNCLALYPECNINTE